MGLAAVRKLVKVWRKILLFHSVGPNSLSPRKVLAPTLIPPTIRYPRQMKVLIVGMGGTGVETAKNVLLQGTRAVTLFDPVIRARPSLGAAARGGCAHPTWSASSLIRNRLAPLALA